MFSKADLNKIKIKINKNKSFLPNIFAALGDQRRFQIFQLLLENNDLCVGDIAYILNISIAAVSQHMKILEMNNLIESEKRGQMVCYKVKLSNKLNNKILKLIKGR
ncbi:MAG: ArsR/SmtB family transcription factor [Minisyncoccia bacterium]